jgi:hypothetical protein
MNGKEFTDIVNGIDCIKKIVDERHSVRIEVDAKNHEDMKKKIELIRNSVQTERRLVNDDIDKVDNPIGKEQIQNINYERDLPSHVKVIGEKQKECVEVLKRQQKTIIKDYKGKEDEITTEQKRLKILFAKMQAEIKI